MFRIVSRDSVPAEAADPDKFAGDVRQSEILPAQQADGMRGSVLTYGPGARSNWHVHRGEQTLVVVAGRGLVQWAGLAEPRVVEAGDWVHVTPGVPHWHGATQDSSFEHLAITASGGTDWGDPV